MKPLEEIKGQGSTKMLGVVMILLIISLSIAIGFATCANAENKINTKTDVAIGSEYVTGLGQSPIDVEVCAYSEMVFTPDLDSCFHPYEGACFEQQAEGKNEATIARVLVVEGDGRECDAKHCYDIVIRARPGGVIEEIETETKDGQLKVMHFNPPVREMRIEPGSGLGKVVSFTEVAINRDSLVIGNDYWRAKIRGERLPDFRIMTEIHGFVFEAEEITADAFTSRKRMPRDFGGSGENYICTYQQIVNAACGFNGCMSSSGTTCWQGDSSNDDRCRSCR
jgi:hypothetical protein